MRKTVEIPGKKPRNVSLDLVKLLAAYLVVLIHFPFPGTLGEVLVGIARFAVPVFFMVSGYYAYRSEPEAIKGKARNVLKIYLAAFFLYFLYKIFRTALMGSAADVIGYLTGYLDGKVILKFFLFNVTRSSGHLWFMPALIYCYGALYAVRKWRIKENTFFAVAGLLLVAHLFLGEGLSFFGKKISFVLVRNFLLMGIPFFAMGMGIFKYQEKLVKCSGWILVSLFFLGQAEAVASTLFFGKNEIYFGSVLGAVATVILALKAKDMSWGKGAKVLSGISTQIYLWHSLVGELTVLFSLHGWFDPIPCWNILCPILICMVTTMLALLVKKRKAIKTHKGENV